jgi:hypothetical protein
MDFPTTITDIINNVRKTYGITLEILNTLKSDNDYFPPIFEKDELLKIDIHEPNTSRPRIIAFGDIHGDLQALVGILYAAELIDINGDWIEKRSTYLVQTGDIFDNYRPDIEESCLKEPENEFDEFIILNYLTHLHRQAKTKNAESCVVLCIGNHELMNVFGHMNSYVMPGTSLTTTYRTNLFTPGGVFATKLSCIFRVIAKIGNNLFMHGGIHETNIRSLNDIITYNNDLNKWLNNQTRTLSPKIYDGQYLSITWYRKMTNTNEAEYISFLQRLDTKHELKVIVGHMITSAAAAVPSILIRASGQIILLDTAMSRCWSNKLGKPCDLSNTNYNISFIVIENDTITPKHREALVKKELSDKELLNNEIKLKLPTDVQIIKTYNNIKKEQHFFSKNDYHLVLFKYDVNKYGIATMNISDHKLRKIYIIDVKTTINYKKGTQVKFENIINVSNNNDYTSFTIIFNTDNDINDFKLYFPDTQPTSTNGGRKIRSRNNRNRNRTTKQKRNKSIRNKKYYRISRRK